MGRRGRRRPAQSGTYVFFPVVPTVVRNNFSPESAPPRSKNLIPEKVNRDSGGGGNERLNVSTRFFDFRGEGKHGKYRRKPFSYIPETMTLSSTS